MLNKPRGVEIVVTLYKLYKPCGIENMDGGLNLTTKPLYQFNYLMNVFILICGNLIKVFPLSKKWTTTCTAQTALTDDWSRHIDRKHLVWCFLICVLPLTLLIMNFYLENYSVLWDLGQN